jgi:hypothetical protein
MACTLLPNLYEAGALERIGTITPDRDWLGFGRGGSSYFSKGKFYANKFGFQRGDGPLYVLKGEIHFQHAFIYIVHSSNEKKGRGSEHYIILYLKNHEYRVDHDTCSRLNNLCKSHNILCGTKVKVYCWKKTCLRY